MRRVCALSVAGFKPVFKTTADQKRFYERLAEEVKPVIKAQELARARSEHSARRHLVA